MTHAAVFTNTLLATLHVVLITINFCLRHSTEYYTDFCIGVQHSHPEGCISSVIIPTTLVCSSCHPFMYIYNFLVAFYTC